MLSGGGARAAYQVGFLRLLAREFPGVVPDILTGVSAGGINAAFLAARLEPFREKVESLADTWSNIRIDRVFRVDLRDLASRSVRWGGRLLAGGNYPLRPARSMVDTDPLRELLGEMLAAVDGELVGIAQSLQAGWLRAIALTASSYTTGRSVTWVQAGDNCGIQTWERPQRTSVACPLRVDHVVASAALPFFFPAIEVDGAWYGDGGIRLTAPLSPRSISARAALSRCRLATHGRAKRHCVRRSPATRPRRRLAARCTTRSFSTSSTPMPFSCSRSTGSLQNFQRPNVTACARSTCCCCVRLWI
jgi:NTE family protein